MEQNLEQKNEQPKKLKVYSTATREVVKKKQKEPKHVKLARKFRKKYTKAFHKLMQKARKVKRVLTIKKKNENFVNGSYIEKKAKKLYSSFVAEREKTLVGDFPKKKQLPVIFQAREQIISQLIEEKTHSFENPLVILDPYGVSPLCAMAVFNTDSECAVRATVIGTEKRFDVSGEVSKGKEHRVPIIGLYANKLNKVVIELLDDAGNAIASTEIKIKTRPLPILIKNMVKVYKDSGDTAFPLIYVAGKGTKFPYAFDQSGEIRYYLAYRPRGYGLFPLKNGRFIFIDRDVLIPTFEIPHSTQMYEMDWFGRVYKVYQVAKGAHHDVFEKEDGNLMFVSNSLDIHMEDVVREIDRETGKEVRSLDMRDVLGDDFRDYQNWVHVNSCEYHEESKTALISPRNVHSVINVDWETGELNWILCDPRFWEGTALYDKVLKPIGDVEFQYQQHSAFRLNDDLDGNPDTIHIMVFDNHWHKRRKLSFFDDDTNSYVKIFTINEKERTVKLEHKYAGIKSKITSNGLLDFKTRRVFSMSAFLDVPFEGNNGMIYEYDYDTEEMLNHYGVKDNYFRAYQFKPNYNQLATKMEPDKNYRLGELTEPQLVEGFKAPTTEFPKDVYVTFEIFEDQLYVYNKDHVVRKVFFKSAEKTYVFDISNTEQTRQMFDEMVYYITIPMEKVDFGKYDIYIQTGDVVYDFKKSIEVCKNN